MVDIPKITCIDKANDGHEMYINIHINSIFRKKFRYVWSDKLISTVNLAPANFMWHVTLSDKEWARKMGKWGGSNYELWICHACISHHFAMKHHTLWTWTARKKKYEMPILLFNAIFYLVVLFLKWSFVFLTKIMRIIDMASRLGVG